MFKPELKETGWEEIPEEIFSISGEDYNESTAIYKTLHLGEKFTNLEKELSILLNDSLMDILWDSVTESEIESLFKSSLIDWSHEIIKLRIEFDGEFIFGWVHYRENKKINTFRFKISLRGKFNKC